MYLADLKRKTAGHVLRCSDAPNTDGMNRAAEASAEISREALAWYQAEYAKTQPQRDKAIATSQAAADSQLQGMQFANQQAQEAAQRNKTLFQPLEDKVVADAQNYDTPERRQQAAAEAQASVEKAYGSAQDGLARTLARNGTSVNSGRSLALMQDAALSKAKAVTGATSDATRNVEQQGYARKMDAVGLGKGVIGNQATQQQIATTTGNAAVGSAGAGVNAAQSGAAMMGQGFGTALQGQGQAGNLYGQAASLQQSASNANTALFGSLGTAAGMFMSDAAKKRKTGKPANTASMLEQIERTPVDQGWQYDPTKGGVDDGGQPHDGPMAQNVRRTMGDAVAPGGKVIDLVSMNGRLMGGMQELAKRLKAVEQKVAA